MHPFLSVISPTLHFLPPDFYLPSGDTGQLFPTASSELPTVHFFLVSTPGVLQRFHRQGDLFPSLFSPFTPAFPPRTPSQQCPLCFPILHWLQVRFPQSPSCKDTAISTLRVTHYALQARSLEPLKTRRQLPILNSAGTPKHRNHGASLRLPSTHTPLFSKQMNWFAHIPAASRVVLSS